MDIFKELVRFNRYKSIESFNNAKDITSSTISIVKLDENIMDIYLGRTQLTNNGFIEESKKFKSLITQLENQIGDIKKKFNSDLSSIDKKYNKKISEIISELENGLNELVNYSDNLSRKISNVCSDINDIKKNITSLHIEDRHIFELIDGIQETLSKLTNKNTSTSSDIIKIKNSLNEVSNNLLKKIENNISEINKLKIKCSSHNNNIQNINKNIEALHIEDRHIFEIINKLQNINEGILFNIKILKEDNEKINNEITYLKRKIEYITEIESDTLNSLNTIKKKISNLENTDKKLQESINSLKQNVSINNKIYWITL